MPQHVIVGVVEDVLDLQADPLGEMPKSHASRPFTFDDLDFRRGAPTIPDRSAVQAEHSTPQARARGGPRRVARIGESVRVIPGLGIGARPGRSRSVIVLLRTAELLYRDWCRLEHAAGNRQGLHTAITRIQQINRELDCSLETETEQLITERLNNADSSAPKTL